MQTLEFRGDTVVKAPAGMDTTNLAFMSAPNVHVVFSAPIVTLKRTEVSDVGGGSVNSCCIERELTRKVAPPACSRMFR